MQMLADIVAFQSTSVQPDELSGIVFGPWRQDNVVEGFPILLGTQIKVVEIAEKLGQVKELRNEFLDVGHV